jgi:cell division protein FtsQ
MSLDHPLTRIRGHRRAAGRRSRAGARRRGRTLLHGRRLLRALLALVAGLVVAGAAWMWFRDSSFVRVERVSVTGVTSSAEPRIDAALDAAARGMTTLHVRQDALRRSVAGFPSVAGLTVRTDFPHGITIEVLQRRPVAAIVVGSARIAVTADGRLLRDEQDTLGLPAIAGASLPVGPTAAGGPRLRADLAVAGAAPPALLSRAQAIVWRDRGLQVDLVDGPPLIFGGPASAAAKWAAAARVLADPSAAGATYLDLREPGRVAAGGLGPVAAVDPQGDAVDPAASPTPVPTLPTAPAAAAAPTPAAATATAPVATATPVPTAVATPVPTPVTTSAPYSQP